MTSTEHLTLRALVAILSKHCPSDDELIAEVWATLAASQPTRRGRHAMSDTERQSVSERMKKYWAKRKEEKAKGTIPVPDPNQIYLFPGCPSCEEDFRCYFCDSPVCLDHSRPHPNGKARICETCDHANAF